MRNIIKNIIDVSCSPVKDFSVNSRNFARLKKKRRSPCEKRVFLIPKTAKMCGFIPHIFTFCFFVGFFFIRKFKMCRRAPAFRQRRAFRGAKRAHASFRWPLFVRNGSSRKIPHSVGVLRQRKTEPHRQFNFKILIRLHVFFSLIFVFCVLPLYQSMPTQKNHTRKAKVPFPTGGKIVEKRFFSKKTKKFEKPLDIFGKSCIINRVVDNNTENTSRGAFLPRETS